MFILLELVLLVDSAVPWVLCKKPAPWVVQLFLLIITSLENFKASFPRA